MRHSAGARRVDNDAGDRLRLLLGHIGVPLQLGQVGVAILPSLHPCGGGRSSAPLLRAGGHALPAALDSRSKLAMAQATGGDGFEAGNVAVHQRNIEKLAGAVCA